MANTQPRQIRISADRWETFGQLAAPTRAQIINDFIAWFIREPGAKLPKRPDATEPAAEPSKPRGRSHT